MLSPNQIEEIQAQAFCGVASELEGVCKIQPMTIKEIMEFGNLKYQSVIGTLLLTEVEIAEMIKKKIIMQHINEILQILRKYIR